MAVCAHGAPPSHNAQQSIRAAVHGVRLGAHELLFTSTTCQECTKTPRCGACRNVSMTRHAGGGSYCCLSILLSPCAATAAASCRCGDECDAVVRARARDTRLRPRPQVPGSPRGASSTWQATTTGLAARAEPQRGGAAMARQDTGAAEPPEQWRGSGCAGRPLVRARAAVWCGGAAPVGRWWWRGGSRVAVGRGRATRAPSSAGAAVGSGQSAPVRCCGDGGGGGNCGARWGRAVARYSAHLSLLRSLSRPPSARRRLYTVSVK